MRIGKDDMMALLFQIRNVKERDIREMVGDGSWFEGVAEQTAPYKLTLGLCAVPTLSTSVVHVYGEADASGNPVPRCGAIKSAMMHYIDVGQALMEHNKFCSKCITKLTAGEYMEVASKDPAANTLYKFTRRS